jgi:hypothetical protein
MTDTPPSGKLGFWKLRLRRFWLQLTGRTNTSLLLAFREQRLRKELQADQHSKNKQKTHQSKADDGY